MATKCETSVDQAVITGQEYTLWMPTISNAIRQMDQSAPDLDQAKSSGSRDQWISVSPTERRRRIAESFTRLAEESEGVTQTNLRTCYAMLDTVCQPTHAWPACYVLISTPNTLLFTENWENPPFSCTMHSDRGSMQATRRKARRTEARKVLKQQQQSEMTLRASKVVSVRSGCAIAPALCLQSAVRIIFRNRHRQRDEKRTFIPSMKHAQRN
ncbi:hypothetical protein Q8A73_016077 [Channa argus]|nr:hypothetical protein Q8A73_016077 [Channa argus]